MKSLRLLMILAVLGMMTLVVQAQSATPLFDWAANPGNTELTTTTVTNDTNGSRPGREITKLWFAENATDYFFRLDLAGARATSTPAPRTLPKPMPSTSSTPAAAAIPWSRTISPRASATSRTSS